VPHGSWMPERPSTRNLAALPPPPKLEKIWRGFSLLDAIMERQWDMRVFSFDAAPSGSKKGSLGMVRENEGNVVYGLFLPNGSAVLRGYHHESPMNPFLHRKPRRWPGLVEGMPASLLRHRNATDVEPDEVTFVIWYDAETESGWRRGHQRFPKGSDPDGSEELLAHLTGGPDGYVGFAKFYHGRTLPRDPVNRILRGSPVDAMTIRRLNPSRNTNEALREARALGFETKGRSMTTKTSKSKSKPETRKAAPPRKRTIDVGEAKFTIHALHDKIQMQITAGIVAEAKMTRNLYKELFDHAKATILAASKG
jgi:hypothetical protein